MSNASRTMDRLRVLAWDGVGPGGSQRNGKQRFGLSGTVGLDVVAEPWQAENSRGAVKKAGS